MYKRKTPFSIIQSNHNSNIFPSVNQFSILQIFEIQHFYRYIVIYHKISNFRFCSSICCFFSIFKSFWLFFRKCEQYSDIFEYIFQKYALVLHVQYKPYINCCQCFLALSNRYTQCMLTGKPAILATFKTLKFPFSSYEFVMNRRECRCINNIASISGNVHSTPLRLLASGCHSQPKHRKHSQRHTSAACFDICLLVRTNWSLSTADKPSK